MGDSRLSHRERLHGFYAPLLVQHQEPFKKVGWGSEKGQLTRFKLLSQAMMQSECKTVLDVGCGLGDFAFHCSKVYGRGYTGIDIVPEMIEAAKKRHPTGPEFLECDLLTPPALGARRFDAVVASGIFSHRQAWSYEVRMIWAMWAYATKMLAFNMLSAELPEGEREAHEVYREMAEILAFCQTLTPYAMADHTYRRNDFTIFMYREQQEV
jgi:cyclopropane fatty-acyl-phospholipid synthase-like methyltransferase